MNRILVLSLIGSVRGRAAAVAKRSDETARMPCAARGHSLKSYFLPYFGTLERFRVKLGLVEAVRVTVQ